jgi:hypothetical protein
MPRIRIIHKGLPKALGGLNVPMVNTTTTKNPLAGFKFTFGNNAKQPEPYDVKPPMAPPTTTTTTFNPFVGPMQPALQSKKGVPTMLNPNTPSATGPFGGYNSPTDWAGSLINPKGAPSPEEANKAYNVIPPYSPDYKGPYDPNAVKAFDRNAKAPVDNKFLKGVGKINSGLSKFNSKVDNFVSIAGPVLNYFDNLRKQKEYDKWMGESMQPHNMYAVDCSADQYSPLDSPAQSSLPV